MLRRFLALILAVSLLAACDVGGSPTPDRVATEVAVQQAVAATLTAEALQIAPSPTTAPTDTPQPSPTDTPLPTFTTIPPVEPSSTPKPSPSATALPPAPTRTSVPGPTATAIVWRPEPYAVVGVASDDRLNVRSGPGVNYPLVGSIPAHGLGVQVGQSGQEVADALWLPVWHQGISGWVNSHYLARQVGTVDPEVAARAVQIIMALKSQDMTALSNWVHPDKGVRFSPYTFVRAEDQVFSPSAVANLPSDPTIYLWGAFDGSGEPIQYTFVQYYQRFVYDVDFAQPDVLGLDRFVGSGNTINNIPGFYPGSVTVEYHFEGFDPLYGGMDWRSLRLVLQQHAGEWLLVGIVHDEWTI